ncbi:hypothetical protein T484DRAFT_1802934, partial [Baffinella frigidus]
GHWAAHGREDHRVWPCKQSCPLQYCNSFPDLESSICAGVPCQTTEEEGQCEAHFLAHGMADGREWPCARTFTHRHAASEP